MNSGNKSKRDFEYSSLNSDPFKSITILDELSTVFNKIL